MSVGDVSAYDVGEQIYRALTDLLELQMNSVDAYRDVEQVRESVAPVERVVWRTAEEDPEYSAQPGVYAAVDAKDKLGTAQMELKSAAGNIELAHQALRSYFDRNFDLASGGSGGGASPRQQAEKNLADEKRKSRRRHWMKVALNIAGIAIAAIGIAGVAPAAASLAALGITGAKAGLIWAERRQTKVAARTAKGNWFYKGLKKEGRSDALYAYAGLIIDLATFGASQGLGHSIEQVKDMPLKEALESFHTQVEHADGGVKVVDNMWELWRDRAGRRRERRRR